MLPREMELQSIFLSFGVCNKWICWVRELVTNLKLLCQRNQESSRFVCPSFMAKNRSPLSHCVVLEKLKLRRQKSSSPGSTTRVPLFGALPNGPMTIRKKRERGDDYCAAPSVGRTIANLTSLHLTCCQSNSQTCIFGVSPVLRGTPHVETILATRLQWVEVMADVCYMKGPRSRNSRTESSRTFRSIHTVVCGADCGCLWLRVLGLFTEKQKDDVRSNGYYRAYICIYKPAVTCVSEKERE